MQIMVLRVYLFYFQLNYFKEIIFYLFKIKGKI